MLFQLISALNRSLMLLKCSLLFYSHFQMIFFLFCLRIDSSDKGNSRIPEYFRLRDSSDARFCEYLRSRDSSDTRFCEYLRSRDSSDTRFCEYLRSRDSSNTQIREVVRTREGLFG
jgi:hypothetical protein